MKVFYSGVTHNYYDEKRGVSFEHATFYAALKNLPGTELVYFPFERILTIGKKQFNEELLGAVKKERPDALFIFMLSDEFEPRVLNEIKKYTTTIAWFADDSWRFYNYSRYYAPHFTWVVTTYAQIVEEYRRLGMKNIIKSQWACNAAAWKPIHVARDKDISFVGQKNSSRAKIVRALRSASLPVTARGNGWEEGRIGGEEMIKMISRSKINLNLNTPPPLFAPAQLGRLLLARSLNRISLNLWHPVANFEAWWHMRIPQLKARTFELPGCGVFVVCGYARGLEECYKENKEMVFYRSTKDLIDKIKYYLPREEERERIAKAGYERTLRDHTYEKRLKDVFKAAGVLL